MALSTRHKRVLTWVGYPLLALVTFTFAAAHTFPYGRLKQRIVDLLSQRFNTSIASVKPTFLPGGLVIKTIMLQTRPRSPDKKPVSIVIDEIDLHVGLLALLRGKVDVNVVADIGGGKVDGQLKYSKAGIDADVDTKGLPLQNLPWIRSAVGLPAHGDLNASVALDLPKFRWSEAKGKITLSCPGCTVGDGVSKIKIRSRYGRTNAFDAKGLTVPKIDLGDLSAEMDIQGGEGTIKKFAAKSADGELHITGKIHFADPFRDSRFPGCMRFKLSNDFKRRQPKFGDVGLLLPARTRQADGFNALPMHGRLRALRWDPRRTCGASPGEPRARRARPTIIAPPPRTRKSASSRLPPGASTAAQQVQVPSAAARTPPARSLAKHVTRTHVAPSHGASSKPTIPQKPPRRLVIKQSNSGRAPPSQNANNRGGSAEDGRGQQRPDDVGARDDVRPAYQDDVHGTRPENGPRGRRRPDDVRPANEPGAGPPPGDSGGAY